jgi:hypothetical protein
MMRVVRAPLLRGEGKCVDLGILLLLFPVLPAFVHTHFFIFFSSFYLAVRQNIWTKFVFVLIAPVLSIFHL